MITNKSIPLSQIHPPRLQPRLEEDDKEIQELAASIQAQGLIAPLAVMSTGDGYQILAGNRRYKALRMIGAETVDCRVFTVDLDMGDQITIAENLIRRNLSVVEEAYAFAVYLNRTGESHEWLAGKLGKERTYVTRRLLILDLDDTTLAALEEGIINLTQALILRQLDRPEIREKLIEHAQKYGANARIMQQWVDGWKKEQAAARAADQRELQPGEYQPSREVFMACDRCGDPTSYDVLRSIYVCPPCRQATAAYRVIKEGER